MLVCVGGIANIEISRFFAFEFEKSAAEVPSMHIFETHSRAETVTNHPVFKDQIAI